MPGCLDFNSSVHADDTVGVLSEHTPKGIDEFNFGDSVQVAVSREGSETRNDPRRYHDRVMSHDFWNHKQTPDIGSPMSFD